MTSRIKKVLASLLMFTFVMSMVTAYAEEEKEGYVNKEQKFVDTMDDLGRTYDHDGPWAIKVDDAMPEDSCRIFRSYAVPSYMVWKSERPITGFYFKVLRITKEKMPLDIYMSKDGQTWRKIECVETGTEPGAVNWTWYYMMQAEPLAVSDGYFYMKAEAALEGSYSPQISHVEYYTDGAATSGDIEESREPTPLEKSKYRNQLEFFIADGDLSAENIDAEITRAEFADFIAKTARIDGLDTKPEFSDVYLTTEYYTAINALANHKIMNGFTDGSFRPGDAVTYEQAAMICANMLGYGRAGYSSMELYQRAVALGIGKGIEQAPFTKEKAAAMVYSAINEKALVLDSLTAGGSEVIKYSERSFMYEFMNIEERSGKITATRLGSLSEEASDGRIAIDLQQYTPTDESIHNYLGYTVDYYIRTDDESNAKSIIYYSIADDNSMHQLTGRDIDSVDTHYLHYKTDEEKTSKFKIAPQYVVVNGNRVFTADIDTIKALRTKDCYFTALDSDGDKTFETFIVYEFEMCNVETIDSNNKTVIDELSGNEYCFDADKVGKVTFISKGDFVDFRTIKKDDVLSIARSTGYTTVFIASRKISSSISGMETDGFIINEKKYPITFDFEAKRNNPAYDYASISIGFSGDFYLDFLNNVAFVKGSTGKSKYMYLLWMGEDETDGTMQFKLYDGSKIAYYKCENKVRINNGTNTRKYNYTEAYTLLTSAAGSVEQLVMCSLTDEGKIRTIQIAKNVPDEMTFSLDHQNAAAAIEENSVIDLKFAVDTSKTKVFVIPYDKGDDESFATSLRLFKTESYGISLYDVDEGGIPAVAVVSLGKNYGTKQSLAYSGFAVFDKLSYLYDENTGETITELKVLYNNQLQTLRVGKNFKGVEGSSDISLDSLKRGDILRTGNDHTGMLSRVQLIYSIEEDKHKGTTTVENEDYTACGTVVGISGMYMRVKIDGDTEPYRILYANTNVRYGIIDTAESVVNTATVKDIRKGDRVVMYNFKTSVKDMILIR